MNKIKVFLILILSGFLFGSCEGIFEPDKDNQYRLDRVLNDPAFAEGILLKAYQMLPSEYSFDDVATDNAVSNDKNNAYLKMATGEWSAMFNPMDVWGSSYDAIFNVNYFLSVVDSVNWSWKSENRAKLFASRFKGEALALRAYHHMRLLMSHGGVASDGELYGIPIVNKVFNKKDDWKLERNTYKECLYQIIQDFDSAFNILPYIWTDYPEEVDSQLVFGPQNLNRINGKIIKALKSRLYLHLASPLLNNGNYDTDLCENAASITGELLDEIGGITGLDEDGHLFYVKDTGFELSEILWKNNYYNSLGREQNNFPPSLFGNGNVNPTQNLVDAFPMENGYPINSGSSGYDPASPYENRDPRLAAYIVYNGAQLGAKEIYTQTDDPTNSDMLNNKTTSTRTGYYLAKLLRADVNLDPTVMSTKRHFYTHIRYTELFLNYAEAANEAWGPDSDPNGYGFTARTIISAIRKRAKIDVADPYLASLTTKEEMRDLIRNERRLELCFEGFRFWDLRRWNLDLNETAKGVEINNNQYIYIDVERRKYKDYMYYSPIPNIEVIKYSELKQNLGW